MPQTHLETFSISLRSVQDFRVNPGHLHVTQLSPEAWEEDFGVLG